MAKLISIWTARTGVLLLLLAAALPLLPTGAWFVRLFDFPRLQLCLLLLVPLLAATLHAVWLRNWKREHGVLVIAIAALGLWQCSFIAPYTPLWPKEVADATMSDGVRVMITNLKFDNRQHERARRALQSEDPDLLLLIEINRTWSAALDSLRASYPYRKEVIRDEGLGLALWSKLPLVSATVEHLVSERRPSIFATVRLRDGTRMHFAGVHPTPPGLEDDTRGGRRDSRVRDAELVLVARKVEDRPNAGWIVAGDLNDVAWSRSTQLFKRISGLRDPRVGRALLNTYHADYHLLRYPIDHLFVSEGTTLEALSRVRLPGSDHFAIVAQLHVSSRTAPATADADERSEAREVVEEGKEDAAERDIEAGDDGP